MIFHWPSNATTHNDMQYRTRTRTSLEACTTTVIHLDTIPKERKHVASVWFGLHGQRRARYFPVCRNIVVRGIISSTKREPHGIQRAGNVCTSNADATALSSRRPSKDIMAHNQLMRFCLYHSIGGRSPLARSLCRKTPQHTTTYIGNAVRRCCALWCVWY